MQVEPIDKYAAFVQEWARAFGLVVSPTARAAGRIDIQAAREQANTDEQASLLEGLRQLGERRRVRRWVEEL